MRHIPWATATALAFLLGLWVGSWTPPDGVGSPPGEGEVRTLRQGSAAQPAPAPEAAPPAAPETWPAAMARLEEMARAGDRDGAAALRARLFGRLRDQSRDGRAAEAEAALLDYLAANPHDAEALLLQADLRQMQGRLLDALEPLIELLQFADDPAMVQRARDALRLVVNVHESQLANRRDVSALVRFFRDLTARDPGFDGHRLRLAHWLLRAGRADEAERTLRETGVAGVDPEALSDLAAEIRLARTGLPLEHTDRGLHVRARAGGEALRLLVDTGASTTAIARARADALGATATGRHVQVRTAAGLIEAPVLELHGFQVGPLELQSLTVLALDHPLPDGVDGLLGMDVLSRFPARGDTEPSAALRR